MKTKQVLNVNGLDIKNFKRLRAHIAKNVKPLEIFMEWYMVSRPALGDYNETGDPSLYPMDGKLDKRDCGTAACIYGHTTAFCKNRRYFNSNAIRSFAEKFLGTGSDSFRLIAVHGWPDRLENAYKNGTPRQKKAAVLARLDRVIKRGDLY